MNKSIDQQPSHHDTRPEYAFTKIEVAIKEDNKLHRKFKLALCDAKKSKHEKDIYKQALQMIKVDQQEALEELVQTGERSTVPPGVLQRYQEERASCEAMLAAIAREEDQAMKDGGYGAEDKVMEATTHLGYAPLTPDEAAEQTNEIYNATPLGKDVQQRRQIVKDRIGEINAELAYYMGLAEPPLAVISEETAIRIWGKEAVEKAQSTDNESEPGHIDVFPDNDRTPRSGNKLGYGSRTTPEFIKKDASQRLAEVLVGSAGEAWTVQELGDAIYDPSKVQTKLERYRRANALLYSAQKLDSPTMIITEELERSGLVLQRGRRYLINEHGQRGYSTNVYRAVSADIAMQGLTEERPVSGRRAKQQIQWTPYDTAAAAHEAANTTRSEASRTTDNTKHESSASSVPGIDDALAKRALEAARVAADRQAAEAKEQQEALHAAEVALSAEVRAQIEQLVELAQPLIDSLRENSVDDNADKQVFPIQDLPEIRSQCASEHDLEIFLNKARQAGLINKKQLRNRALPSAGEALVLILYAYDPHTMYDLVRNDASKRVLQHKFQQAYENRAVQVVNRREGGASAAQESTTS